MQRKNRHSIIYALKSGHQSGENCDNATAESTNQPLIAAPHPQPVPTRRRRWRAGRFDCAPGCMTHVSFRPSFNEWCANLKSPSLTGCLSRLCPPAAAVGFTATNRWEKVQAGGWRGSYLTLLCGDNTLQRKPQTHNQTNTSVSQHSHTPPVGKESSLLDKDQYL